MSSSIEALASADLATGYGEDGHLYTVRTLAWTIQKIEEYAGMFDRFQILPDEIPQGLNGFTWFVVNTTALWFEVWDDTEGETVGLMFVTDLLKSPFLSDFTCANWHAVVWDMKASPRLEIARAAIRELFKRLKLHRLEAHIPLNHGGAIRIARQLGFKEEGVARSARRYKGVWYNVLMLSIIEDDLDGRSAAT